MFHGNRWAGAFITILGDNAGEGFLCLKALVKPLRGASGLLFGYSAARRLETMLRGSDIAIKGITSSASASSGGNAALEYVIRYITLLVEKNQFRNIDLILHKIEESLDAKNGILSVTVESASPLDAVFEGELRRRIIARTGAADIKMKMVLSPALLGGYRLRIGGFYVDASLKGQMERMKADLEADI